MHFCKNFIQFRRIGRINYIKLFGDVSRRVLFKILCNSFGKELASRKAVAFGELVRGMK